MAALREVLARFGVQFDRRQLDRGNRSIENTLGKLQQLGALVAGSLIVQGIKNFVDEIREAGDELDKTSQQLGITTTELQSFRHAAGLSGASAEDASNSLRYLQKNLQDAATGGSTTSEMFDIMGISAKTADGAVRNVNDVLPEIAQHFKESENASEKTAIAMTLLGRSGTKLIPLLNSGSEGIQKMRAELQELGGGLDEDAIRASVELTDTLARLDLAFVSFKSRIATALLPVLDSFAKGLGSVSVALSKALKGTNLIQAALIVLGGAGVAGVLKLVGGFGALLSMINKLIIRIALPILLVEDLITTFQGGDTIIRRVIDGIFGEGQTKRIVDAISSVGENFSQMIDDIQNDRQAFEDNMRRTSQQIEDDFGATAAFVFEAMANALSLIVSDSEEKTSRLTQRWEEFKAIMSAIGDFIAAKFSNAATIIENAFAGLWNNIISKGQSVIESVGGLISNLPGVDDPFEKAREGLEDMKREMGKLDQRDFAAFARLNDNSVPTSGSQELAQRSGAATAAVASAPARTSNNTSQTVNNQTTVNMELPPGTSPNNAREIGRETGRAVNRANRRATQAALTPAG